MVTSCNVQFNLLCESPKKIPHQLNLGKPHFQDPKICQRMSMRKTIKNYFVQIGYFSAFLMLRKILNTTIVKSNMRGPKSTH